MIEFPLAVEFEQDEDGLIVARVPAIPGCSTQARDWETLYENLKEVISLCFESDYDQRHEQLTQPSKPETLIDKVTKYFKPKQPKTVKSFGYVTLMMKDDAELEDPLVNCKKTSIVEPHNTNTTFTIGG